ncbi:hypothetical protein JRQ81_011761 [Phrynocephalus forsythii]|uniref:Secreted protein n=1 Tax=Phrynocephalus forsythii TaxID=171643 RepID=A0A9Q0X9Q5_9SAUR|nr:hypothetical protein JRQ81_011761 [Phrynocephalus forsythii]
MQNTGALIFMLTFQICSLETETPTELVPSDRLVPTRISLPSPANFQGFDNAGKDPGGAVAFPERADGESREFATDTRSAL